MNGTYTIYKRDPATGIRSEFIERYTEFSLTINWGELSSFSISGATTGAVELAEGDGVCFYRNGAVLLSGIVETVEITCKDTGTGIKEWTAEGRDDSVLFTRWLVSEDGVNTTFNDNIYDKVSDYAWNRMVHYIRRNMGTDSLSWRQIDGLILPAAQNTGQNTESAIRWQPLSDVLYEIAAEVDSNGVPNGLMPRFIWDPETGTKSIRIDTQRDRTDIIIAPEFCNLGSWTRTLSVPTCNAILVCSATFEDENGKEIRLWVSAEDQASVTKYGRYEQLITASDIKVTEDDPDTPEDESISQAEALELLANKARDGLTEGAAKVKFSGTMIETPELRFQDDWICGDLVTCIIDGESFVTSIKTVEIDYANGVESVKPTLGENEHGEFAGIFERLRGLDTRLSKEELNG